MGNIELNFYSVLICINMSWSKNKLPEFKILESRTREIKIFDSQFKFCKPGKDLGKPCPHQLTAQ